MSFISADERGLLEDYLQQVSLKTQGRIYKGLEKRQEINLVKPKYKNAQYARREANKALLHIPIVGSIYLAKQQNKVAANDEKIAYNVSKQYNPRLQKIFYENTLATIKSQNKEQWAGAGVMVALEVLAIGTAVYGGYYAYETYYAAPFRRDALRAARMSSMIAADNQAGIELGKATTARKAMAKTAGRRAANVLRGAAAEGGMGDGIRLADETTSLLAESGGGAAPAETTLRKRTSSILSRFRFGRESVSVKGTIQGAAEETESLVASHVSEWQVRHQGLYGKDIGMNFKEEVYQRIGDGSKTLAKGRNITVKRKKALEIMEDMGFESHGNFNGHEKFSHPLFEPYPKGIPHVNFWFNLQNGTEVDMDFMAKMLHRRYGNPLLTFGQL